MQRCSMVPSAESYFHFFIFHIINMQGLYLKVVNLILNATAKLKFVYKLGRPVLSSNRMKTKVFLSKPFLSALKNLANLGGKCILFLNSRKHFSKRPVL